MMYFFGSLTEVVVDSEFSSYFLMKLSNNESPNEHILHIVSNFRGKGRFDETNKVWFDQNICITEWRYQQISKDDYKVLTKYLATL